MRALAEQYPLRMVFSEREDDEFVVNVSVVIIDGHGKQVFELSNACPLLYVKLPYGHHKVSAWFKDRTESREVALAGHNGKDLYESLKSTGPTGRGMHVHMQFRCAAHHASLSGTRHAARRVRGLIVCPAF